MLVVAPLYVAEKPHPMMDTPMPALDMAAVMLLQGAMAAPMLMEDSPMTPVAVSAEPGLAKVRMLELAPVVLHDADVPTVAALMDCLVPPV